MNKFLVVFNVYAPLPSYYIFNFCHHEGQNEMDYQKNFKELEIKYNRLENKYHMLLLEHSNCKDRWEEEFLNRNRTLFTENQMKLLTGKSKKVVWNSEDLSRAFTLRRIGRKNYELLTSLFKFPIPCTRTLDRYSKCLSIAPG
jgi:hypothetical protein